jgi:superfamily II DNA helicase RecQ
MANVQAEEIEQPAFFVLHQKCLLQIVEQLPSSLEELRRIKGMGKRKIKAFGDEIIEIIDRYCVENGMPREESAFKNQLKFDIGGNSAG